MTQTRFTPGPWHWDWSIPCVGDLKAEDGFILEFCDYEGLYFASPDGDQDEANAHLIAAAPELYEALSEVFSSLSQGDDRADDAWADLNGTQVQMITDALAKARGES